VSVDAIGVTRVDVADYDRSTKMYAARLYLTETGRQQVEAIIPLMAQTALVVLLH
jgi:hypothetical protein